MFSLILFCYPTRVCAGCCSPQALRHHTMEEEEEYLPEFAKRINSYDILRELGRKFEKAKAKAPTRWVVYVTIYDT